jgi:transposase
MNKHYPVEQRERAVKMVLDHLDEYRSVYAACQVIGPKVGVGCESLRRWVLQAQVDANQRPGTTSAEQQRIKELEREVRDLKEANEILKAASAFFGSSTRAAADLLVHRSDACARVSGRVDLRRAFRAGCAGRPTHVPQLEDRRAVGADGRRCSRDRCAAGYHRHPGGHVRAAQDDGLSAPPGPSGGDLHGGSADARRGAVRGDPGSAASHHHRGREGFAPGTGSAGSRL